MQKGTFKDRSLVLLIKTLDLTKPLPDEIPVDIKNLIQERLQDSVRTIENWLIKTFISKGITLRSGKKHGLHICGDAPWTPSYYYRYTCFWFGKEHGYQFCENDNDPPEELNYHLGVEHGLQSYPTSQYGDMESENYNHGVLVDINYTVHTTYLMDIGTGEVQTAVNEYFAT